MTDKPGKTDIAAATIAHNGDNGDLRDRIAAALASVEVVLDVWDNLNETSTFLLADAVIRELTEAIPPIVATAIQGYAQSGLAALSHHGDASAIEELKRMNKEALHIAQYATTHEDWNGEWKRYD
jgi:hypothetical protein